MVVGELLVAMRDAKLVQPPHEPAGSVEQVELILLAAVDVERLQPVEIVRIPISAAKALDRKEASATRRLASLYASIKEIENELAEIRNAKAALSQPTNGKKVKLPKIIGT